MQISELQVLKFLSSQYRCWYQVKFVKLGEGCLNKEAEWETRIEPFDRERERLKHAYMGTAARAAQ